jgi:ABC-type nitrate/sulfonate/bicarbonate transport system substrate-binding protein
MSGSRNAAALLSPDERRQINLMLRKKPIFVFGALTFVCIMGVSSCGTSDSSSKTQTYTLTLARTMSPINLLLDVAEQQHLWAQEGIAVREQVFPSARQAMDTIVTNSSDMATVADTPLLIADHRQPNLKLLCTLAASDHHVALVLDSNQIQPTCNGLRTKRIALSIGTQQQYFLDHYLQGDATRCGAAIVNLQPVDAQTAFVKGNQIDGVVAWEPQLSRELERRGAVLVQGGPFPGVFALAYGPHSKLVDSSLRVRIRKVLGRASEWVGQHPIETRALLASSQSLPMKAAESLRQRYSFSIDREEEMISVMAGQEQWAKDKGYIPSVFGADELRRQLER